MVKMVLGSTHVDTSLQDLAILEDKIMEILLLPPSISHVSTKDTELAAKVTQLRDKELTIRFSFEPYDIPITAITMLFGLYECTCERRNATQSF